jgi:hypothetical protein
VYGGPGLETGYKVIETSDGGALMAGIQSSYAGKLLLVKVDSTGSSGCNESNSLENYNPVTINDSSYSITGYSEFLTETTANMGSGSGTSCYDICSMIGIVEPNTQSFHIFPNPANENLTIQIDKNQQGPILIELMDVSGKLVKNIISANPETILNLKNVQSGIYFLRIKSESAAYSTRKVVVE